MTREFDKKNAAKSRAKCADMAEAASTGKRVLSERERQILDIWPKFEDGEPVMVGDKYEDNEGNECFASGVHLDIDGPSLVDTEGFHDLYRNGKRVERPVQSVLDADGVEIKVGDTVWFKGNPRPYAVVEVKDGSVRLHSKTYCSEESATTAFTDILTHIAPDSWERLEEDAKKTECGYFGINGLTIRRCRTCSKYDSDVSCDQAVKLDIVRRAKALAGIEVD